LTEFAQVHFCKARKLQKGFIGGFKNGSGANRKRSAIDAAAEAISLLGSTEATKVVLRATSFLDAS